MNKIISQTILITGASSGIGQALAEYYAQPGVTLFLGARNKKRLIQTKRVCEAKGARVEAENIDVCDYPATAGWIKSVDDKFPIDLIIANAGISMGKKKTSRQLTEALIQTNLYGVLNTIEPIIPLMKSRKKGKIAVMSSLAAYRAFPQRGLYSATKAAVRALCDAWRLELEGDNILVSVIHPGFVKTPLVENNPYPMPFILSADYAAQKIAKDLAKGKPIIAFPKVPFYLLRFLTCMPTAFIDFLIRKFGK